MGGIISSIRRAVKSISKFNKTVFELRQNIADFRKCTKDVVNIMNDLKIISHEVKQTVSECSSELQSAICEQIYSRLSQEDLENLSHIVCFDELVTIINEMQKIDGDVATGDLLAYLFEKTILKLREYKGRWKNQEGKLELLNEIERYINGCSQYQIDTLSTYDDSNTMQTFLDDTCKICDGDDFEAGKELEKIDSRDQAWIEMTPFHNDQRNFNEIKIAKEKEKRKESFQYILKLRHRQMSEATRKIKNIRVFCLLFRFQAEFHKKLVDHLNISSFENIKTIKAAFISRIIEGGEIYQKDSELYSPCMAKVNFLLEKVLRKRDLSDLNLKIKIKYDINFKEVLPLIDNAVAKVKNSRIEVVNGLMSVKSALLVDIQSFHSGNSMKTLKEKDQLQIVPFQETFSVLKEKGGATLENNIEEIVQRFDVFEKLKTKRILQLTDFPAKEKEIKEILFWIMKQSVKINEKANLRLLFKTSEKLFSNSKHGYINEDTIHLLISACERDLKLQKFLNDKLNDEKSIFSGDNFAQLKELLKVALEREQLLKLIKNFKKEDSDVLFGNILQAFKSNFVQEAINREPTTILTIASKCFNESDVPGELADIGGKMLLSQSTNILNKPALVTIFAELLKISEDNIKDNEEFKKELIRNLLHRVIQ